MSGPPQSQQLLRQAAEFLIGLDNAGREFTTPRIAYVDGLKGDLWNSPKRSNNY